jgi:ABC-type lipopolysaccharide export system ATPase subunit
MKFQLEKLGNLKQATIELGDLTILCGDNNTGKTYASYAIYGFLTSWQETIDFNVAASQLQQLLQKGILKLDLRTFEEQLPAILQKLSHRYSQSLAQVFNTSEDYFAQTSFQALLADYQPTYQKSIDSAIGLPGKELIKLFKAEHRSLLEIILTAANPENIPSATLLNRFINKKLGMALLGDYFANPFMITSERTGVSLFYRELDPNKTLLVERLQPVDRQKQLKNEDGVAITEETVSRYARPVKQEIQFVRDLPAVHKKNSLWSQEQPGLIKLLKEIVGGEYVVQDNQLGFVFKRGPKTDTIPLHFASASAKSLLELTFYLNGLAQPGDLLMIEEPELNLHPAKQRKMARLLVRLIKAGIKVFITTHSDYLIKELNNLIILANLFEDRDEIMTKYGYTEADVLEKSQLRTYSADHNTLVPVAIDALGIPVSSFDREIREMNDMFDDMTVTLEIAYQ